MADLSHSPYLGYIVFSILFTLSPLMILTLKAKREFKRVARELAR